MTSLLRKRLLAFLIDYLIIALYASLLFWGALTFFRFSGRSVAMADPVQGQLIGFITITLPVFLYFYLSEKGNRKATIGKRKMDIHIRAVHGNIFLRNIIKFMPWEIAHTGVQWVVYYSDKGADTPVWVWIVLILPQVIIACYAFSIVHHGGSSSFYDSVAGTRITAGRP